MNGTSLAACNEYCTLRQCSAVLEKHTNKCESQSILCPFLLVLYDKAADCPSCAFSGSLCAMSARADTAKQTCQLSLTLVITLSSHSCYLWHKHFDGCFQESSIQCLNCVVASVDYSIFLIHMKLFNMWILLLSSVLQLQLEKPLLIGTTVSVFMMQSLTWGLLAKSKCLKSCPVHSQRCFKSWNKEIL